MQRSRIIAEGGFGREAKDRLSADITADRLAGFAFEGEFGNESHCERVQCSPELECRGSLAAYAADGDEPLIAAVEVIKPRLAIDQQMGRDALSREEEFELDARNVDHQSFWLELKIFWLTFASIARPNDITSEQSATAEEFKGNRA